MRIVKLRGNPGECDEAITHFGAVWELALESGEETKPQRTQIEEIYCCVEGRGEIYLNDNRHTVASGDVLVVPKLTSHWLANPSSPLLRCLTVEAVKPTGAEGAVEAAEPASAEAEEPVDPEAAIPGTIEVLEAQIGSLPKMLDQVAAIQHIVQIFDTAGQLSEQIENAYGLDNAEGVDALAKIERQIMDAVVEITKRYQRGSIDVSGFGGRFKNL